MLHKKTFYADVDGDGRVTTYIDKSLDDYVGAHCEEEDNGEYTCSKFITDNCTDKQIKVHRDFVKLTEN